MAQTKINCFYINNTEKGIKWSQSLLPQQLITLYTQYIFVYKIFTSGISQLFSWVLVSCAQIFNSKVEPKQQPPEGDTQTQEHPKSQEQ